MFAGLSENVLSKAQDPQIGGPHVRLATYDKGQVILREGEYIDAAFVILSGDVLYRLTSLPASLREPQPPLLPSRRAGKPDGAQEFVGRPEVEQGTVIMEIPRSNSARPSS